MSDNKCYRHLFPSEILSSTNCSKKFGSIEKSNYPDSKNNTLSWFSSGNITKENLKNIKLESSSPSIHRSRIKIFKSQNGSRIAKNMKRIELLSQPKFRVENSRLKSVSMNSVKNNKKEFSKMEKMNVDCSSASTSHRFRAVTPRLLRLAQPKIHETSNLNIKKCCIGDGEKLEMAKMSKRLEELAEPKKLKFRTNKDPFKINPQALKATCSTRVEALARPKGFSQPFPQLLQAYLDRVFVEP